MGTISFPMAGQPLLIGIVGCLYDDDLVCHEIYFVDTALDFHAVTQKTFEYKFAFRLGKYGGHIFHNKGFGLVFS